MSIEQLDQIGREVAKRIAAKYSEIEIGFSVDSSRDGTEHSATVIISSKEGSGEVVHPLNAAHLMALAPNAAEQTLDQLIDSLAQRFMGARG